MSTGFDSWKCLRIRLCEQKASVDSCRKRAALSAWQSPYLILFYRPKKSFIGGTTNGPRRDRTPSAVSARHGSCGKTSRCVGCLLRWRRVSSREEILFSRVIQRVLNPILGSHTSQARRRVRSQFAAIRLVQRSPRSPLFLAHPLRSATPRYPAGRENRVSHASVRTFGCGDM